MPKPNLLPKLVTLAKALRKVRPEVMPGTNLILDNRVRTAYYDLVNYHIYAQNLKGTEVGVFCDIAGIPD